MMSFLRRTWNDLLEFKLEILVVATVILAMLRFQMPSHELSWPGTYEAFAHLFVGGLIGAYLATRDITFMVLVGILTLVEVVAFFTLR